MYNITFLQIATFFAVAERLNVSKTADAMYISQPALSKTIHRLEEGIGLKLFARSNRGLVLTKEGEYLYLKMRSSYNSMCKHIEHAQKMENMPHKIINIGYPSTYDSSKDYDKLKWLINDYSLQHPNIEINEILYDFLELKQALIYGDVDIAFIHDFMLDGAPNISMKRVCRSRRCLAMSARHPLAAFDTIDLINKEDLAKEVFYTIPFHDDSSDKKRAILMLNEYGINPKTVQIVPNFQSFIRLLRLGRGMGVCGYFLNVPGREEIKFFELPLLGDSPFLTVAWRTKDVSKAAQDFISTIPDNPDGMTVFKCRQKHK
ncbi:LysR family transcriptional regulator [Sporomusa termitida]|uniref:HTH-type transcriptional regulator BenM n=1 Tax=Sporomusa termitida TaxID=2377 RepID=A0A517E1U5_9FIRM|nr:LysR family transcriptional regulator [Sporomusa termitida]QDR83476.1 HTH-type transcriptional regulator BenM [Sporomusa termitida]